MRGCNSLASPWIPQCNDMCTQMVCHRWYLIRRITSQTYVHNLKLINLTRHQAEYFISYKTVKSNCWYHVLVSMKVEECKKCMYLSSMGMRERFTVVLLMVLMLSVILIIREQRRISACKSCYSYFPSFYSFKLY